ncbi:MAG TPA: hypothetical protein VFC75_02235, partial [Erysipelothrix sp.]|nr:hypothetical protein [Erysipelothrix sp.]
LYVILNTYSAHLNHEDVLETLRHKFKEKHIHHGTFDSHQLAIPITQNNKLLTLGNTTRWCIYEDLLRR